MSSYTLDIAYGRVGNVVTNYRSLIRSAQRCINKLKVMHQVTYDTPYCRTAYIKYVGPHAEAGVIYPGDLLVACVCASDVRLRDEVTSVMLNIREDFDNQVVYINREYWNHCSDDEKAMLLASETIAVWNLPTEFRDYIVDATGLIDESRVEAAHTAWLEESARLQEEQRINEQAEHCANALDILRHCSLALDKSSYLERLGEQRRALAEALENYSLACAKVVEMFSTPEETAAQLVEALEPYKSHIIDMHVTTEDGRFGRLILTLHTTLAVWVPEEIPAALTYIKGCYSAPWVNFFMHELLYHNLELEIEQSVSIRPGRVAQYETEGRYLHNPHLKHFDCWGMNSGMFSSAWVTGQYDIAMAVINNTVQQLNLTDYTVCRVFTRDVIDAASDTLQQPCVTYRGQKMNIKQFADAYARGDYNE